MPPNSSDLTDLGLAGLFAGRYAGSLKFCQSWKSWLVYEAGRWARDNKLTHQRLARELVQELRGAAGRIRDHAERFRFEQGIRRAESMGAIAAMTNLAKCDPRIIATPDEFDRDPYLFNCRNGTLDLKTGELRPHDPADRLTRIAPVGFDPGATCPAWGAALDRVMGGDPEMIGFLRRIAGYALTGDVGAQCLFLLYGRGGNGKSAVLNALLNVVGDYGMTAPGGLLAERAFAQHPTSLADLEGRRFVAISEPPAGRIDEALMKALTGGDAIRARRMHGDFYEFAPTHKLFMASNHKPEVREMTPAVWRRIMLIVFDVAIPPDQQDGGLGEKLKREASGILNWMVAGCLEWQRLGDLAPPEKVRRETSDYRDEQDVLGEFISLRCEQGSSHRARTRELYDAFVSWRRSSAPHGGGQAIGEKEFAGLLDQRGYHARKTGGVMIRVGIALKPAVEGPTSQGKATSEEADASGEGLGADREGVLPFVRDAI